MNLSRRLTVLDRGPAGQQAPPVSRRSFIRHSAVLGLGISLGVGGLSGCASSSSSSSSSPSAAGRNSSENFTGLTPDQALEKLRDGNDRYVAMKIDPNVSSTRRTSLAEGQHPFAGVIGCIDSRVPPELVFDRGLGELFVGRVGAAIADNSQIGGMEFGVLEFGMPLIVVLGHERCGAVTAAVEAREKGETPPGEIGSIVTPIVPAIAAAEADPQSPVDLVEQSVHESVSLTVAALRRSPVLSGLIAAEKLKVVGARYDLDTGRVDFLGQPPPG